VGWVMNPSPGDALVCCVKKCGTFTGKEDPMPLMTTHCVLLLCGAGCLPVIASSYVRSGTKPPDKDVVNCPARAELHSPQRGEHSNLDCNYLRVFRLHNQGNITDCSLLLRPRLFRGVTPYRRDGESISCLPGLHIPATHKPNAVLQGRLWTASTHVPYAVN